jgi:hypothetical protein
MKIECVGAGFTYRWPTGEISLEPGQPVELPDDRALKLLAKAPGRVRIIPAVQAGDVIAWECADGVYAGQEEMECVDFVHVDSEGTVWAFVSSVCGNRWAAVNMKYARILRLDEPYVPFGAASVLPG